MGKYLPGEGSVWGAAQLPSPVSLNPDPAGRSLLIRCLKREHRGQEAKVLGGVHKLIM